MSLPLQILDDIAAYPQIVIHSHVLPDYDTLGAVFALRAIILSCWPEKTVFVVGEKPSRFDLVPEMDSLDDSAWEGALAICCDASSADRISDKRFRLAKKVIKIDHHHDYDPFGDLFWVDTTKVATAEMIVDLYLAGTARYPLQLTPEACLYLYCGMISDSGRCQFVSTPQAGSFFAALSLVVRFGKLDPQAIGQRLYLTEEAELRLRGYLLSSFKRPHPAFAYATIDAVTLERFGLTWQEAHGESNSLMGIRGVRLWALFVEAPSEGRIFCELRSNSPAVNKLAHRFGGGGHRFASGCQVAGWDVVEQVIEAMLELVKEGNSAT